MQTPAPKKPDANARRGTKRQAAVEPARPQPAAMPAAPATPPSPADRVGLLEKKAQSGLAESILLRQTVKRLTAGAAGPIPAQLTPRARRLLEFAKTLVAKLRHLAADFASPDGARSAQDALTPFLRQTVAMAEIALRMVQAFPDAPAEQVSLCEGLEAVLGAAAQRTAALSGAVEQRRLVARRTAALARCLEQLSRGATADAPSLRGLAEEILDGARRSEPLHACVGVGGAAGPADAVARHSLATAEVLARVVGRDGVWGTRPADAVLAALVHDAGMLQVPSDVLGRPGSLDLEQKRSIEAHARVGAELVARAFPGADWLAAAVAEHHERLDGTGYPAGKRSPEITPLARLLAVCDVYAALVQPRPYRAAGDPRTALADTLLMAEQGLLDPKFAEWLLGLSFYPVGSAVELTDGRVGVVVATHMGRRDERTPGRPVVAVLTDARRTPLSVASYLDLNECEGCGVARTVSADERAELLARSHPEWA